MILKVPSLGNVGHFVRGGGGWGWGWVESQAIWCIQLTHLTHKTENFPSISKWRFYFGRLSGLSHMISADAVYLRTFLFVWWYSPFVLGKPNSQWILHQVKEIIKLRKTDKDSNCVKLNSNLHVVLQDYGLLEVEINAHRYLAWA